MDLEKDTDGDGLTDYNEWAYGTDINDVDSDNDGLSDYEEIGIIGTDATNVDTDSDGILDGDEDADNDGLTNSEECQYGTSSCTLDTDGDKVSDYDEIYSYQTNPLNMDTDGDGADDKWEIDREYDANAWDNSFCIIQKEQGLDTAAEIELFASGEVASSFAMRIHENDGVFINSLIPGYLGSAYDFVIDGEFETATLKYYFDESYLEEEGFNPVIYYYNEETHELEEIDTYWDGESNYVTAELSHFSTYLLLNKTKFEEVWEKEIKAPSVEGGGETSLNIAFVVDLSGSMSGTKLSTTKTAIKSFINVLGDNDLGALISFTNKAFIRCKLTSDKDALTASVNSMSAYGLTAIYAGIEKAVSTLTQNPVSGYDMIIVFTDGYDEPSTTYEAYYKELVQQAIDNNIIIYTIGIQTVDENLLKTISQATGGSYYYASVISELQDKLDSIKQETVDYTTDSNDDGISDYYTKLICNGTLRLSTGSVIPEFIGNYDEIQKNADYDKDGLNNGKEIEIVEKYGRVYFEILSDPTEADFDEDGILDSAEKANKTNPFIYNASTIDVDYLFYDDIYIASMLGKDYLDDGVLRAQLGFGNLLLNGKGTYVNDYKQALLQFIELYNDAVFEEGKVAAIKDMYMENLDEIMLELTNYALVLDDVAFELSGYAEAASLYEKSAEKLISLKNTLKTIEDYKSLVEFNDEINTTCLNLQVQLLEQESANAAASKAIKSSKLIGNLEKKMGQYINNMPSKVTTAMKAINAFNNVISYGTIVIGTGADVLETLDLYGALDIGMIQYVELDEFLESIILYSDNSELVLAATDVRYALSEDFARSISEIGMVVGDLGEGAYTAALTFALSKCGPIGWAIGLGWSLGDLMSNTSTVNEELLKVIAYGDAGVSYRKKLENRLPYETPLYYQCNVSLLTELQLLGQLRVVGEDKYAYAQNERGFLKMWIDGIFGDTQEEVEETCRDTIEAVVRKCNNFQVSIYKKFIGSYLN
ncbi:MAG: VWA domain-containing protein [Lachnospiraceae bacterium]|nr:VWA domain-containing protein [Lachnospiraceae bacterium]